MWQLNRIGTYRQKKMLFCYKNSICYSFDCIFFGKKKGISSERSVVAPSCHGEKLNKWKLKWNPLKIKIIWSNIRNKSKIKHKKKKKIHRGPKLPLKKLKTKTKILKRYKENIFFKKQFSFVVDQNYYSDCIYNRIEDSTCCTLWYYTIKVHTDV